MAIESGNGANVIVVNTQEEILVVKQNYGHNQWMLPGGGIERGESPRHAASEETEEESGIVIDEIDMRLIGIFVQRPKGLVCLYEARKYSGHLIIEPSDEILEARFMSFQEIINRGEEFGLAYRRMIIRYKRCMKKLDQIPVEARLADAVEYPKGLDVEFEGVILQV